MSKMNELVKPLWLNALRSDEFTQGAGVLHSNDDTYCCLGVLCELYMRHSEENIDWRYDNHRAQYYLFGEEELLPVKVMEWAGIEDNSGTINLSDMTYTTLAELNDSGYTFAELADLIEKQY